MLRFRPPPQRESRASTHGDDGGVYNGGPFGSMGGDKLHPTAIGHEDVARAIVEKLAE